MLMLDDRTSNEGGSDQQLHSISHGVISLQRFTLEFGAARQRLEVLKLRGMQFRAGWHDYVIRRGGLVIFPRLVASEHHSPFIGEPVPSGNPQLDALLHGGPLRGTSTLVSGPAGSGKTSLTLQYAMAAAQRGEKVVIYEFDERLGTLLPLMLGAIAVAGLAPLPVVDAHTPLDALTRLLTRRNPAVLIRRDGKLSGIITRFDVLRYLTGTRS